MMEFLEEPANIYLIAFILFLVLAFIFLRKPALRWLDSEIGKISTELETARELRAEAEAVLNDMKEKQVAAEKDAKMIVDMAKDQAESLRKQADEELHATLARQEHLASERIRLAEEKAIATVRLAAINMGMDLARKHLATNLSEADAAKLIDDAIADMPAIKNAKVK